MTESYFIDGVGDEVTLTFGILIAIVIVVASWLSTRVNDVNYATNETNRTRQHADPSTVPDTAEVPSSNVDSTEATPEDLNSRNETESTSSVREEQSGGDTLRQRHTQASSSVTPSQVDEPDSATIKIRLKYMDESSTTVEANPDETLESFRNRCLPVETQSRYRLIYRGQVLRDGTRTLRQLNLVINQDGDSDAVPVVHCFLSPVVNVQENVAGSASQQLQMMAEELHIGSLFLPVLGLILAGIWYLCLFHTSLFSIQSVVSIVGFTFLYIIILINTFS